MAEDNKKDMDDLKSQFSKDLKEARSFMQPIQQRMDKDYETYRNVPDNDEAQFKISDLFTYVETVVPIVTNNRIRANVRSDYPDYIVQAKGINDILDHTYDTNNWDYTSQEIMRLALIYRSSFAYSGYDKEAKNGTGKLCLKLVNPRWCMVDPSATQLEDSRFFFYVEPKRPTEVMKMHPDKKQEIKRAIGSNESNSWGNQDNGNSGWFKTWLRSVKSALVFNRTVTSAKNIDPYSFTPEIDEQQKHKNVVAYIHYWYRDDEDSWRCSYWADDTPLSDNDNPFWHGQLPYDIFSPIKDPLSMLGIPISEQIESMSVQRNLLMNYVISNAKLQGNPPLLYNTSFGNLKDPKRLNEEAWGDGIIPVNNPDFAPLNSIADYMQVPNMPNGAPLFEQLGQMVDGVTGVNDSFRGTQQASSGKEVQLQQEAAYTRIKTMVDQLELFNKKIAEKTIINAMQFLNQNRAYRIKGDYQKYDNDIQANSDAMPLEIEKIQKGQDEQGQPVYDRTEFFLYANPNEWTKIQEEESEEPTDKDDGKPTESKVDKAYKILQMTVEIEAGSSLPQSRLARREEAAELFSAGAIDQQSLLDTYDWPDREEIMKRMQEQAQAQQQAQAESAQAQAQAQMQAEQQKLQQQMQLEQMKLEADMQKNVMNNDAKMQQTHVQNRGDIAEQGMQNTGNGLAEILDNIRQSNPQAAQLSDTELITALMGGG